MKKPFTRDSCLFQTELPTVNVKTNYTKNQSSETDVTSGFQIMKPGKIIQKNQLRQF